VRGDAVGEMLFSGKGAGSLPTASAVLSDVVDIACHRKRFSVSSRQDRVSAGVYDHPSRYYVRFSVGEPSAIGRITTVFNRNGIEVTRAAAVWGRNGSSKHQVRLLTQPSSRKTIEAALLAVAQLKLETAKNLVLTVAA